MPALDQQHAAIVNDDGAYAYQRRIGIFSLHKRGRKKDSSKTAGTDLPGTRLFGQWNAIDISPRILAGVGVIIGRSRGFDFLPDRDQSLVSPQVRNCPDTCGRKVWKTSGQVHGQPVSVRIVRGMEGHEEDLAAHVPTAVAEGIAHEDGRAPVDGEGNSHGKVFLIRAFGRYHNPAAIRGDRVNVENRFRCDLAALSRIRADAVQEILPAFGGTHEEIAIR